MADITQLSDEELQQLANQSSQQPDITQLSDEELNSLAKQSQEQKQSDYINMRDEAFAKAHPVMSGAENVSNFLMNPLTKTLTGKSLTERSQSVPLSGDPSSLPNLIGQFTGGLARDVAATGVDMATSPLSLLGGAVKGVGMAANGIGKAIKPFKESKNIVNELNALKQEVGLPKEATKGFIGQTLGKKKSKILDLKKQNIKNINQSVASKLEDINNQQNIFENSILENKATDFAKYMKQEGVKWMRDGSKAYGETLDKVASMIDDTTPITAEDAMNFMNNTVKELEAQGLNSPYLNTLRDKYTQLFEKQFTSYGNYKPEEKLLNFSADFKQLKDELSGVYGHISSNLRSGKYIENSDRIASITKDNWVNFISKYIPKEGIDIYSKLQKDYSRFAQAKREIGSMFHPYSGEFDFQTGINSAKRIAMNNMDEGTKNLMEVLDKGIPGFISGAKEFPEQLQSLNKVGQQSKVLDMFPGLVKSSGKLAKSKEEDIAAQQLKKISAWRERYNELVELEKRNKEAKDKIMNMMSLGIRPAIKGIKKAVGL